MRTLADGGLSQALILLGLGISRPLYACERAAARLSLPARLRSRLRRSARQSARLPYVVRHSLHRIGAQVRRRLGSRNLNTLLRAEGFDSHTIAFDYLEGLSQQRGCETAIRRQRQTYSLLIGVDFVRSEGNLWFLEANYNPSLVDERLALYEEGNDPWVNRILDCAERRGHRRVVAYGYRPFSPGHATALIDGGRKRGVQVDVIDDLFSRPNAGHPRALLMANGADQEGFVLRAKGYDVLFDDAILSKQLTRRIVEQAPIDWPNVNIRLPRLLPAGQPVPNYVPSSRYPNIVAKIDELDRGAGVSFYKGPIAPPVRDTGADYCEEYRIPDPCCFKLVRGVREEIADESLRAWKIRSFALLTPEGVEYLASIKVISGLTVPEQLPDGPVVRKNIYLVTVNEGGFYSAVTPEEDAEYERGVQVIGNALLAWLRRKYSGDETVAAR
ncbi:MAG: hypothetical protein HY270_20190 [Deltaproteobacteria bacterium]|nr:hypothetical protein [Deltaproteobacteria bacterium]